MAPGPCDSFSPSFSFGTWFKLPAVATGAPSMLGEEADDALAIILLFALFVVCGVMIGPDVNPWMLF